MPKITLSASLRAPESFNAIRRVALHHAGVFEKALKARIAKGPPVKVPDFTERERKAISLTRAHFPGGDGHARYLSKLLAIMFDNPAVEKAISGSAEGLSAESKMQLDLLLELKLARDMEDDGKECEYYTEWLPVFVFGRSNGHSYNLDSVVIVSRIDSDGDTLANNQGFELDPDDPLNPFQICDHLPGVADLRVATVAETTAFFSAMQKAREDGDNEEHLSADSILRTIDARPARLRAVGSPRGKLVVPDEKT